MLICNYVSMHSENHNYNNLSLLIRDTSDTNIFCDIGGVPAKIKK